MNNDECQAELDRLKQVERDLQHEMRMQHGSNQWMMAENAKLKLLAENYRGIIREMLETSDVKYTDQSEVFERARAALDGNCEWIRVYSADDLYDDHEKLKFKIEKALSSLEDGGYNSARETIALMAEGEGNDPEVYRTMASYTLKRIDEALAALKDGESK